jgi:hypothetical protein
LRISPVEREEEEKTETKTIQDEGEEGNNQR